MNFVLHPWHIALLYFSAMIDGERDKAPVTPLDCREPSGISSGKRLKELKYLD